MVDVTVIGSKWAHEEGTVYSRNSHDEYIFIHFLTPVVLDGKDVEAGTVIIYDKNTDREFFSKKGRLVHDWFHFTGDGAYLMERSGISFCTPYTVKDADPISDLVEKMQEELTKCRTGYRFMVNSMVEELFVLLSRATTDDAPTNVQSRRRSEFEALRRQMLTSFSQPWTVEKMAERVYLSPSRFFDTYRDMFGVSPKTDLQNARIAEAKKLLVKGMAVAEVAFAVGYNSIYHFIRQFHRVVGVSPGKYAAAIKNSEDRPRAEL